MAVVATTTATCH